jgi:hypothetical protein
MITGSVCDAKFFNRVSCPDPNLIFEELRRLLELAVRFRLVIDHALAEPTRFRALAFLISSRPSSTSANPPRRGAGEISIRDVRLVRRRQG